MTPASTNPQITERKMWNVFRTCGRDDQQGAVAGAYILKHFKGKKVAVVHDKTTYGKGLADETIKAMAKGGMKPVLYEGINVGEKDFSALVSKIKQSGADLVYWGGLHTEGGLIVRQMRDQGVKAPMMGADGITTDEFAQIGGPGVEGTLMTFAPGPAQQPERQGGRGRSSAPPSSSRKPTRSTAYAAVQVMAGRREGREVERSQEGGREDALGHALQDRDRRPLLRQEGRHHPSRLRDVHLEEAAGWQDHLRRVPRQRLQQGEIRLARRPRNAKSPPVSGGLFVWGPCRGAAGSRQQSCVLRRRSGAITYAEVLAVPGLQRTTDVMRCARDKRYPILPSPGNTSSSQMLS